MKIHSPGLAALLAASAAAVATPLAAQSAGPDAFAITNARIVTGTGSTIARGTVVIRDGLIAAVGASASVPADARVIDGGGLTVYPGLIDALTSLGTPPAPAGDGGGRGGGRGGGAPEPGGSAPSASTQPVGLRPEVITADLVTPGGDEIAGGRTAGFTAALTAPRRGLFLGQSALINLAGETPQEMIVQTPVAMNIAFNGIGGGYPGSLLGVFAALRQILLDAQHYGEAQVAYAKSPLGMRRPAFDPSLAALQPVLSRDMPVIMYANTEVEIDRALDLAQEFNLRPIIGGGAQADRLAARLKAANVPVLLTLNLPRRTTARAPGEEPESMRVLRERVEAPKVAGRLAAAGIRFAFHTSGLGNVSDAMPNVRQMIAAGLPAEQALRAFTVNPAEIFGVANRLGSVEVGKIANLTVARVDVFGPEGVVTQVFIDGRPYAPAAAVAAGGAGRAGGGGGAGGAQVTRETAVAAAGSWAMQFNLGGQTILATMNLSQEGERLTGTISSENNTAPLTSGRIGSNGGFNIRLSWTVNGQTLEAVLDGTITGNEMSGTAQVAGTGAAPFTGRRGNPPPPAGGGPNGRND